MITCFREARIAPYILPRKLAGRKHYPLVSMLEPLSGCNGAVASGESGPDFKFEPSRRGPMSPEIPLDRQRPAQYVYSRHVESAVAVFERLGVNKTRKRLPVGR